MLALTRRMVLGLPCPGVGCLLWGRCWWFFFFFFYRRTSISGKLFSSGFEGLFLKPDGPEQRETLLYFAELRDERSNFEAGERGNRSAGVETSWCNNRAPTVSPVAGSPGSHRYRFPTGGLILCILPRGASEQQWFTFLFVVRFFCFSR